MKTTIQISARKIIFLFSILFVLKANAQAPEKMSFQAVVRNANNTLVTNANVGIKISILQGTATGPSVYWQLQTATTNANGLVSITIGDGGFVSGDFYAINWENGPYFIQTETDPTGGTNYTITSTTQLLSVPYALYAKTAGSSSNAWGLGGNAGTTSSNFIGTTDDVDVVFKRNNIQSGIISISNTGLGNNSLSSNSTGTANIAIGNYSLNQNTTGVNNSAIGSHALQNNTTGNSNNAFGVNSLFNNSIGENNTTNGFNTLFFNTTGSYNNATGFEAMYNNTTGNSNNAFGNRALYSNSTGNANTAFGNAALYNNTQNGNTAIGNEAMFYNTIGGSNTAVGIFVLHDNTTGNYNTSIGSYSLKSNTTGQWNTANGVNALTSNIAGDNNTAMGMNCLQYNYASNNTAIGRSALISNTSGASNVAMGVGALAQNNIGNDNVAVGVNSLFDNAGTMNVAIGNYSGHDINAGVSNTVCIGHLSGSSTLTSNTVRIGNTNMTSIGGQVGWTSWSDKRIKTNVKNDVHGLDFITKLNPVTYFIDLNQQEFLQNQGNITEIGDYAGKNDIEKIKFSGFLAQDVEAAAKSIGYDFSGVDAPKDTNGIYGLRYSEFVVPIVKAIQEQQAQIEALKQEQVILSQEETIKNLQLTVIELTKKIEAIESLLTK